MMKKILLVAILAGVWSSSSFAALKEVVKEASGSGSTQHQAISEALLIAVQSVNGATVSPRADIEETVNMSVSNNQWKYSGKVSPVFSVDNVGSGSVTKFQVLSVSGSKDNYRAKVRAHVLQFQSSVQDQHLRRIAVLPFQFAERNNRSNATNSAGEFSDELADVLGNYLAQSGQLSLLDRHYIEEMQYENAFLQWDGAPSEMARIGQKVGADFLLVGRINSLSAANSNQMYGLNAGSEQVRLTWRVIEANTSKVVASGTFNRALANSSVQNMLNNNLDENSVEKIAQSLSQDVLSGLKLQSSASYGYGTQDASYTPTYDVTPGSSEKPIKWD